MTTKPPEVGSLDLGALVQQAQRLQQELARVQGELAGKSVEGSAGGGMVTVVASGRLEILSVRIERDAIDPADPHMLEDLVVAAVNLALRHAQELQQREMARATGGLGLPGLPGVPL